MARKRYKPEDIVARLCQSDVLHRSPSMQEQCNWTNRRVLVRVAMCSGPSLGSERIGAANPYGDEWSESPSTKVVTYGVPGTAAAAFQGTCAPGSNSTSASRLIGYDRSGCSEGREVLLSLSTNSYKQQFLRKVGGAELDVGISGVEHDADIDDTSWDALASISSLTSQAAGKALAGLSLNRASQRPSASSSPQYQRSKWPSHKGPSLRCQSRKCLSLGCRGSNHTIHAAVASRRPRNSLAINSERSNA